MSLLSFRPRLSNRPLGSDTASRDPLLAIITSIIISSVLVVYPLPSELAFSRPLFFLLIMLFWVLCQPAWCGIWFAFFLGLATDFMLDTMLGQYAFSFVVIAFLARYFTQNQRVLNFMNLWIIAAVGVFLHLLIQFFLQKMANIQFQFFKHWQPLLPSIVAWPVIYFLLKRWKA